MSDSHTNIKHREMLVDLGLEGYATYWICLELVAQQGVSFRLNNNKSWKKVLKDITKLSEEKLDKILKRFAELNLICSKSLLKDELYIPKMKERADEYSVRKSGHYRESVGLEQIRIDKNRIDKIRLVYTTLKNHSLTNYSSNDYARTGKAIVELINRAKDNDALVLEALEWMGEQKFEWTLETLNKKWVDFMAYKQSKPQVQKL